MYNFAMLAVITNELTKSGLPPWDFGQVNRTHLWINKELDFIPVKDMIFDFSYANLKVAEIRYLVDMKKFDLRFYNLTLAPDDYQRIVGEFIKDGWQVI